MATSTVTNPVQAVRAERPSCCAILNLDSGSECGLAAVVTAHYRTDLGIDFSCSYCQQHSDRVRKSAVPFIKLVAKEVL